MTFSISAEFIAEQNSKKESHLAEDHAALGRQLARRGVDIEAVTERAMDYAIAVPTWGVGTGGTRFARFPGPGEPRHVFDKIEDCGVIHQLTRTTPRSRRISPGTRSRTIARCARRRRPMISPSMR